MRPDPFTVGLAEHQGPTHWPSVLPDESRSTSVNVLLRVYAKCVYGQDEVAKARIDAALVLTTAVDEPDAAKTSPRIPREQP